MREEKLFYTSNLGGNCIGTYADCLDYFSETLQKLGYNGNNLQDLADCLNHNDVYGVGTCVEVI